MKVWKELKRIISHQYMQQYLDAEHIEYMYEEHLKDEYGESYMTTDLLDLEQKRIKAAIAISDAIRKLPRKLRPAMRRRYVEGRRILADKSKIRRGLEKIEVPRDFFKERIVEMIESEIDHEHDEKLPFD